MHASPRHTRYIEIDLLRTLAILLMVSYHIVFDLYYFQQRNINPFSVFWLAIQRVSCSLFLLLVGISFAISWHRKSELPFSARYRKTFARAMGVFGWGLVISLVTAIFLRADYIRFGILHLIGISLLLLPFFAVLREWVLLPALFILAIGVLAEPVRISSPLLLPFGFMPANFASVDYFPIFPWFGLILGGYAIGYFFYVRRKLKPSPVPNSLWNLSSPGRYSLAIYLVHQPLLLMILFLCGGLH